MWKVYGALSLLLGSGLASDWPRFRGPNGSGVSEIANLPTRFGPEENVVWRSPVPPGGSSPVVYGKRVFITAYEGANRVVLCLDADNGRLLWRKSVEKARTERQTRPNDPATPTPVTDGANLYVLFPELGLLSYSAGGQERWRTPLGPFNPPHGMASSPILAGGNVVLAADQVGGSFIAAFAPGTGKLVWKVDRPSFVGGYSTPVTYAPVGGPDQIVVSSPSEVAAYSAATGEKLWSAGRMGVMPVGVPVFGDGLLYVNNGSVPPFQELAVTFKADKNGDGKLTPDEFPDPAFREAVLAIDRVYGNGDGAIDQKEWDGALKLMQSMNALVAVRPGSGIKPDERERWRVTKGMPDVPSPLFYKGGLYLVKDGGVATLLNPGTGEVVKQTRLQGALDKYFASPVAADGKIYFTSDAGKIVVVRAGPETEILAVNDLREEIYATPAIANGGLYVRTREAVYFFAK
jgi:outer membrane protein assembly factor BamB